MALLHYLYSNTSSLELLSLFLSRGIHFGFLTDPGWIRSVFASQLAPVTGDKLLDSPSPWHPVDGLLFCYRWGKETAPRWESMYSVNREANRSESLINLAVWQYHFLQPTLARLQDGKAGWRDGGRGGR